MKVSLKWISEFLDSALPSLDEVVTKIGAQLGSIDEVIDLGARYKGIIVVKVIDCQPMENSDHLKVCKIDDGQVAHDVARDENGYIQVVCGAPNVRTGVTVAWLPPGSVVPNTYDKEPFVLESRELRGILSNGMLASSKELAIGDSHEGLLILDNDQASTQSQTFNAWDERSPVAGSDFATTFKLDDYVIDIENKMFTHRPDLFGQLGVAREIAGILGHTFTSPDIYNEVTVSDELNDAQSLKIINELPELVPRFVAQVFENITVKASPVWLQSYLSRVGIRPINNVVDITNYFMVLTGQPLHAYDYDKVHAQDPDTDYATLIVRYPHAGEKIKLLNGKEIEPRREAIMIATPDKAIGLGGVMGGADTEVDEQTKRIILECATFDMYSIRRTSMAHGVFSDAVTRFNKGQSPLQNHRIIRWATQALSAYAGATAQELVDINKLPETVTERDSLYVPVTIEGSFINERLGLHIDTTQMASLLSNVEFDVTVDDTRLQVAAPFWRTDIELREDVIEEIGRLYGFDKLPLELPRRTIVPTFKDQLLELKNMVRNVLAGAGANEVLTYSFVHGNLIDKVGQDKKLAFKLSNALSPDLQYFRLSLTPSLLEKIHPNIKAGYNQFSLFEIGKAHNKELFHDETSLPHEIERLAVIYAADKKSDVTNNGAAYYQARNYLLHLLSELGIAAETFVPLNIQNYDKATEQFISPYEPKRSATIMIDDQIIGELGEYKASVRKALKLPDFCAGFELNLAAVAERISNQKPYVVLPKYPSVSQDLCLRVDMKLPYQELLDVIKTEFDTVSPKHTYRTLHPVDIYQRNDEQQQKQVTFRLSMASYEKTMTDKELSAVLDDVTHAAQEAFRAERV